MTLPKPIHAMLGLERLMGSKITTIRLIFLFGILRKISDRIELSSQCKVASQDFDKYHKQAGAELSRGQPKVGL